MSPNVTLPEPQAGPAPDSSRLEPSLAEASRAITKQEVPSTSVSGRRFRIVQLLLPLLATGLGLLLWQGLFLSHLIKPYLLPAPRAVADRWWYLARRGVLWHHTQATLREALIGFLVAFVVAVTLGYLLARSETLMAVLAPYLALTQAVPVVAFAPLLVVWFGLGLLPKVVICVLIVFFPMLINTVVGLRTIDRNLPLAARGLGASRWQVLWRIEVPLALRTLLGGVKMGVTLSMTGAVVGEFVAADAGLGYLMNLGRTAYDTPTVFAASLTMAGLATFGFGAVTALEHLLIRWE